MVLFIPFKAVSVDSFQPRSDLFGYGCFCVGLVGYVLASPCNRGGCCAGEWWWWLWGEVVVPARCCYGVVVMWWCGGDVVA